MNFVLQKRANRVCLSIILSSLLHFGANYNMNSVNNNASDGGSKMETMWNLLYAYFLRYFLPKKVGIFWAIFNGILAFSFVYFTFYFVKSWKCTNRNRNLIKKKKLSLENALKCLREELGKGEDETKLEKRKRISSLNFSQLRNALQKGDCTAVESVDAFRWKSLMVNEKYNCVTEFVKEAMDMATRLDEKFKNKQKPPLFGVPFSVKDEYYMKGYDSCLGLAKYTDEPVRETCTFITYLQSLGAIPIVRTNVPQTLLSYVCSNTIWGTTLNPHNTKRTPGGSSGGEGCIVAAGGCPFGIGSDLAGSLRIPAHFCGIATLKPSSGRLKVMFAWGIPGVTKLALSYGYFAKDVETIIYLSSLTYCKEYFDANPLCCPVPFRQWSKPKQPLRVGYFTDDGWIESVPACKRAVMKAVENLKAQGHEVVEFSVPKPYDAMRYMLKAMLPDNANVWCQAVEYEDIDPLLKPTAVMLNCPLFLRRIGTNLMYKWPQMQLATDSFVQNLDDLRQTYADIDEYVKNFTTLWTSLKLDAIVCPVFPFPAIPHEFPAKLGVAAFATGLYNMLDYPSGVVPMTVVNEDDDRKLISEYPKTTDGRPLENYSMWDNPVYATIRQAAANSAGLPVGVQVVALPYQEEKCLQVMEILDRNKVL